MPSYACCGSIREIFYMLLYPIAITDTSNMPELLKSGGVANPAGSKGLKNPSINNKKK
jgi:hypothetical protein